MAKPNVPQKSPYIKMLAPGDHWWCTCGKSATQPLCDGSHEGSEFAPLKFTVTSRAPQSLCGCKHTKTPPYCDGSHCELK